MDRKIIGDGGEVTVYVGEKQIGPPIVIVGINGKSHNPDRHATTLTADEARRLAKLLNAAADIA